MNAQAPALSLASDLLTGTELNAVQVRELFQLATSVRFCRERCFAFECPQEKPSADG